MDGELATVQGLFVQELPLGLAPNDAPHRAIFELAIYWLAKIYMRVDWKKIVRSKNVYSDDVFEHRVKAALSQPNIRRVNDRLCEMLGLQSVAVPARVFDELATNTHVLRYLRREVVYFTIKATELAHILFKRKLWVRI